MASPSSQASAKSTATAATSSSKPRPRSKYRRLGDLLHEEEANTAKIPSSKAKTAETTHRSAPDASSNLKKAPPPAKTHDGTNKKKNAFLGPFAHARTTSTAILSSKEEKTAETTTHRSAPTNASSNLKEAPPPPAKTSTHDTTNKKKNAFLGHFAHARTTTARVSVAKSPDHQPPPTPAAATAKTIRAPADEDEAVSPPQVARSKDNFFTSKAVETVTGASVHPHSNQFKPGSLETTVQKAVPGSLYAPSSSSTTSSNKRDPASHAQSTSSKKRMADLAPEHTLNVSSYSNSDNDDDDEAAGLLHKKKRAKPTPPSSSSKSPFSVRDSHGGEFSPIGTASPNHSSFLGDLDFTKTPLASDDNGKQPALTASATRASFGGGASTYDSSTSMMATGAGGTKRGCDEESEEENDNEQFRDGESTSRVEDDSLHDDDGTEAGKEEDHHVPMKGGKSCAASFSIDDDEGEAATATRRDDTQKEDEAKAHSSVDTSMHARLALDGSSDHSSKSDQSSIMNISDIPGGSKVYPSDESNDCSFSISDIPGGRQSVSRRRSGDQNNTSGSASSTDAKQDSSAGTSDQSRVSSKSDQSSIMNISDIPGASRDESNYCSFTIADIPGGHKSSDKSQTNDGDDEQLGVDVTKENSLDRSKVPAGADDDTRAAKDNNNKDSGADQDDEMPLPAPDEGKSATSEDVTVGGGSAKNGDETPNDDVPAKESTSPNTSHSADDDNDDGAETASSEDKQEEHDDKQADDAATLADGKIRSKNAATEGKTESTTRSEPTLPDSIDKDDDNSVKTNEEGAMPLPDDEGVAATSEGATMDEASANSNKESTNKSQIGADDEESVKTNEDGEMPPPDDEDMAATSEGATMEDASAKSHKESSNKSQIGAGDDKSAKNSKDDEMPTPDDKSSTLEEATRSARREGITGGEGSDDDDSSWNKDDRSKDDDVGSRTLADTEGARAFDRAADAKKAAEDNDKSELNNSDQEDDKSQRGVKGGRDARVSSASAKDDGELEGRREEQPNEDETGSQVSAEQRRLAAQRRSHCEQKRAEKWDAMKAEQNPAEELADMARQCDPVCSEEKAKRMQTSCDELKSQGSKGMPRGCSTYVNHEELVWLLVPGAIVQVMRNAASRKWKVKFWERHGATMTFTLKEWNVSDKFIQYIFTDRAYRLVERSTAETPGWKNVEKLQYHYRYVETLTFDKIRPRYDQGVEMLDSAADVSVFYDDCDKIFTNARWEEADEARAEDFAKDMKAVIDERRAKQIPYFHRLPVGCASARTEDAVDDDGYEYAVVEGNKVPIHYKQQEGSRTCLPDAICSAFHLWAPSDKWKASVEDMHKNLLAVRYDDSHVTRCFGAICKTMNRKQRDLGDFDPVKAVQGDGRNAYTVTQPVLAKLKTKNCVHCVAFCNELLVEPSLEFALTISKKNLDLICGGDGAFEGFDWAIQFPYKQSGASKKKKKQKKTAEPDNLDSTATNNKKKAEQSAPGKHERSNEIPDADKPKKKKRKKKKTATVVLAEPNKSLEQVAIQKPHERPGMSNDGLPDGWEAASDPRTGKVYYCHRQSRASQWEKPKVEILPEGWSVALDMITGRNYYFHTSGKTQWQKPAI